MRNVFITGASRGLGSALAEYFSREGWFVYLGYCGNPEGAETLAAKLGNAEALGGDISDPTAVEAMFRRIDRLDVLVNNARFCPSPRPEGVAESDWWDRNLDISLKGTYLCSLAALELMKPQREGAILQVSSIRGVKANEFDRIPYGAAKAGQISLARSLALEAAPWNIRVNALLPGAIETENIRARVSPERYAEVTKEIPLGRMGTMEEVCHAAYFLATNTYTTGTTLNCSGGLLLL